LKIIHITASYKPAYIYGGPIQSVGKLCEVLSGDNRLAVGEDAFKVEVLTTTANGAKELDVKIGEPVLVEGVRVTYFKRWTKDHSHFSPGLLWGLRKMLGQVGRDRQNKPPRLADTPPKEGNVIHIHAWWNLVSVLSCFIARWYGIPVVLSPRGMLTSYTLGNRNSLSKRLTHKLLGKNLLAYCHIHATSEQERADILSIVKPKSIRVIPNLVSLDLGETGGPYQVASNKELTKDCFKLIFLSRIEEKKGLELLFNALSTIDISWRLTIAGSGDKQYLQSLKQLARELKLSDKIYWLGQVNNQDKYTLMAAHDLLALTSYNENFANVVVESLSVGTPVLISKQVGLADYVEDKKLGWVTGLEISEIREQILNAFQSFTKRSEIRNNSSSIIKKDFSDQTLVEKYINMYIQNGE